MSPPPRSNLTVLQKLVGAYKLWHEFIPHFPKTSRYTLGSKIDALFVDVTEAIVTASFLAPGEKPPYVRKAAVKLDVLKFFLQVAWEIKSLDNKKYAAISAHLTEIGRMLGGWARQLAVKNQRPK